MKSLSILAAVLASAFVGGALSTAIDWPRHSTTITWWYYSEVNGQLSIALGPERTIIGPAYKRAREVQHLLEMFHQAIRHGDVPECHETGYSFPADGWQRLPPVLMLPRRWRNVDHGVEL